MTGAKYNVLLILEDPDDKATLGKMHQLGRDQYLMALLFEELNRRRYIAL